jgi:DNA-binding MarR family transcriptional regulator
MVQQEEVIVFLKDKKWVTMKQLCDHFGVRQQNMSRKIKKMNEFDFVLIRIEGKKYYVRMK